MDQYDDGNRRNHSHVTCDASRVVAERLGEGARALAVLRVELLDARELRVGGLVDVVVEQELERRLELIDDEPGALAEIGHRRIDDEEQPCLRFLRR
ncbi:hypothetical protein WME91_41910 [Sorangium sp. So ce269]